MAPIHIRPATAADLPAINAIYNFYVLRSTCTYQTEPETESARADWFASHGAPHPIIVAEIDGQVVGWGALSRFHARAAYARTVENSIYIRDDMRGQGIGSALLKELIDRARGLGHHAIIAGIDAEQQPSIRLHGRFGFLKVGHLKQVGHKFGRWLDVIYMELIV